MAIPTYEALLLPVLKQAAAGDIKFNAALDRLADEFRLTDDEREQLLPSGKQTLFSVSAR